MGLGVLSDSWFDTVPQTPLQLHKDRSSFVHDHRLLRMLRLGQGLSTVRGSVLKVRGQTLGPTPETWTHNPKGPKDPIIRYSVLG